MFNCIGNTPMVRLLESIVQSKNKVFVKLEEYNWGGSVKSRPALQMILDAEADGTIDINTPSKNVIIEQTGGNTGIGLAQICALRKYKCILVMPDNYSQVRIQVLKDLGAEVILSDSNLGNDSHVKLLEEIYTDNPSFIWLNQTDNDSNPKAHYLTTGVEILNALKNEKITHFVCGVGTGGTISGIGKALREKDREVSIIAVQPEGCDVLKGTAIKHKIEGIAIGRIPRTLNRQIIDYAISVNEDDAFKMKDRLSKECGLYLGISSAANILAAISIAKSSEREACIVTIAPDGGRNYLS